MHYTSYWIRFIYFKGLGSNTFPTYRRYIVFSVKLLFANENYLLMKVIDNQIFIFEQALPISLTRDLAHRSSKVAQSKGFLRKGKASRSGTSLHTTLDGYVIRDEFPEIIAWYYSSVAVAKMIWHENVIPSPYDQSSVNVKIYHSDDCMQGWHTDSNPISALLYLVDNQGSTVFKLSENRTEVVEAVAGRMVLFKGRTLLHGVPTAKSGRVVAIGNLYLENDTYRPKWMDNLEYHNIQPPSPDEIDKDPFLNS